MGQQNERFMLDRRQLLWGVVIGVITVAFMGIAYGVGVEQGKKSTEVLGEQEVQKEVVQQEAYIAVKSDCTGDEESIAEEGEKEIRMYCVDYQEGESAFDVMKRLDERNNNFSFMYEESELGAFVTSVNEYTPDSSSYFWSFLVNGQMSMSGISSYMTNDGDELGLKVEKIQF